MEGGNSRAPSLIPSCDSGQTCAPSLQSLVKTWSHSWWHYCFASLPQHATTPLPHHYSPRAKGGQRQDLLDNSGGRKDSTSLPVQTTSPVRDIFTFPQRSFARDTRSDYFPALQHYRTAHGGHGGNVFFLPALQASLLRKQASFTSDAAASYCFSASACSHLVEIPCLLVSFRPLAEKEGDMRGKLGGGGKDSVSNTSSATRGGHGGQAGGR